MLFNDDRIIFFDKDSWNYILIIIWFTSKYLDNDFKLCCYCLLLVCNYYISRSNFQNGMVYMSKVEFHSRRFKQLFTLFRIVHQSHLAIYYLLQKKWCCGSYSISVHCAIFAAIQHNISHAGSLQEKKSQPIQ